ncbi:MAG: cytochrome P460 family protein [Desulfobacterales bacterium]|nr:cytochrome P460 family protein [Desulfobacterales bacterium]
MKKGLVFMVFAVVLCALFVITGGVSAKDKDKAQVKYPEGYRDWTHVKSMVIQQGHPLYESFGGIHHIYANDKALKAMKAGKSFAKGSVLVSTSWRRRPTTTPSWRGRGRSSASCRKTRKVLRHGRVGFRGVQGGHHGAGRHRSREGLFQLPRRPKRIRITPSASTGSGEFFLTAMRERQ